MKDIANAIAANHPEAYLMMLLIDERPEEVTDMARTVNAEVIASTSTSLQSAMSRLPESCSRRQENGRMRTRCCHLPRFHHLSRPCLQHHSSCIWWVLTGGVDANALRSLRFFGAARNIEGGGSLTIIATALIDTGSKMDEVIFEEFKGTGNMELQLTAHSATSASSPAVNLISSSTRRDDLLQDKTTLDPHVDSAQYHQI